MQYFYLSQQKSRAGQQILPGIIKLLSLVFFCFKIMKIWSLKRSLSIVKMLKVFSSCWSGQVLMRLCLISCILQRWRARRAYFQCRRVNTGRNMCWSTRERSVLSDHSSRCVSEFADIKSEVRWQDVGFWALNDETSAINHQSAHPLLRNTHFTVCW